MFARSLRRSQGDQSRGVRRRTCLLARRSRKNRQILASLSRPLGRQDT